MTVATSSKLDAIGTTAALARFFAVLRPEHLSREERRSVARHLLDTLGAIIAGANSSVTEKVATLLRQQETAGSVPLPGHSGGWQPLTAAYLGGISAHGLELDDGYRAGSVHPGAPVIPAVLAAAWGKRLNGVELASAIAAGYEVTTRVAEAIHPRSRQAGFHNTPVAGVLGAAAACAALLRLNATQCEQVLGIAASSAAGLFAFLHGGGEVKRLHPGMAAREGLFAALLVNQGIEGPRGVLESRDGFFQAFGRSNELVLPAAGRWPHDGSPLNITRCYIKPYACCRHIHPALDAVIDLRAELARGAATLDHIEIGTYGIAAAHAAGGWTDMASAQLSYQFCVATALRFGAVAVSHFSPAALADQETLALVNKISVTVEAAAEQAYPAARSAELSLLLSNGRRLTRRVADATGSDRRPLSDERLKAKFIDLASPLLGAEQADALAERVMNADDPPSAEELLALAVKPSMPPV